MKIGLLLFTVNVVFALWQWSEVRGSYQPVVKYAVGDGVERIGISESGRGCLLLGPLSDQQEARNFLVALSDAGVRSDLIERQEEVAPRYWVYYGPFESYAESLKKQKEFNDKGIDNFIITAQGLYGALSVGVFENIDSAQRMQGYMRDKGYMTSIRNIFDFESVWWIQVWLSDNSRNRIKISQIAQSLGMVIKSRDFFCKTVASENSFT